MYCARESQNQEGFYETEDKLQRHGSAAAAAAACRSACTQQRRLPGRTSACPSAARAPCGAMGEKKNKKKKILLVIY